MAIPVCTVLPHCVIHVGAFVSATIRGFHFSLYTVLLRVFFSTKFTGGKRNGTKQNEKPESERMLKTESECLSRVPKRELLCCLLSASKEQGV